MSNVRSEPILPATRVSWNRIAAIIAWLVGVFFTVLFLLGTAPSLGWLPALIVAVCVQFLLTIAERPLWRWALRRKGGKFVGFGIVVTLVDGAINAGGIYPYVPRLAETGLGKMLIEVFGLSPNISTPSAAVIALAIGLLVACLSEYLWEME
jgi:hypothetical protein